MYRIRLLIIALFVDLNLSAQEMNIGEFGAKADGITNNTLVIQKAIDQLAASGGGTIHFPTGTYLSGSIFLKDTKFSIE